VLVYPRQDGDFKDEERSLIAMATAFAAAAGDHAERDRRAGAQSRDLDQIVGIGRELGSIRDLDALIGRLLVRATQFLGFSRAFAGLKEDRSFRVRWLFGAGESAAVRLVLSRRRGHRSLARTAGVLNQSSRGDRRRPFGSARRLGRPSAARGAGARERGRGSGRAGRARSARSGPITAEDVRRAQALATQVGLALEVTGNLQFSDQPWRRNESLAGLALELASLLRLPEFANRFLSRVADMMGASAAALGHLAGPRT
jgi:hypothetical protein